ncbi:MAG: ABC transporter substrate-binding protein [Thermodesulfobacteriota bacterium]
MPISRTTRWLGIMLLALLASLAAEPCQAVDVDASEGEPVIERLDKTLLSVMKDAEKLGYRGRYEILKPVIEDTYDFTFITRFSIGKIWKTFGEAQREMLIERFTTLSIATYAARFDGYGGEEFRLTSSKPLRRGRILVRTEILKSNGEIIHLDYVLRKKDEKWLAINVIANGVSDLSLKRAQYTSILKKKSFDGLIKKLDKKIAAYEEK